MAAMTPKVMTVVLGDVVGSRQHRARRAMQARLRDCIALANERVPYVQPLLPTIGDEFQGIYLDVAHALDATLQVRVGALPDVDVRFGIASGALDPYDAEQAPFAQDGPAWWAAREAIERMAAEEDAPRVPRGWRTRYAVTDRPRTAAVPPAGLVNSFLACRDEIVGRMDETDLRILRSALGGSPSQESIATEIGSTQPAVSQRMARNGHHALLTARRLLMDHE